MKICFTKMEGCGNDYIYISTFDQNIDNYSLLAKKLSDRHFGIGGDGVIYIAPSSVADAKMIMFNEDGSEGKMCGNGIRCVAKYLYDNKIVNKNTICIETASGLKTVELVLRGTTVIGASVNMGEASIDPKSIPTTLEGKQVIDRPVEFNDSIIHITCVNVGNPHCVIFIDDIENFPVKKTGWMIENSPLFPERTNVEFVHIIDDKHIQMRVWERGAGETLACGTGACASVVAAVLNGYCSKNTPVCVSLLGGDLTITYTDEYIYLEGPAKSVFSGEINV